MDIEKHRKQLVERRAQLITARDQLRGQLETIERELIAMDGAETMLNILEKETTLPVEKEGQDAARL